MAIKDQCLQCMNGSDTMCRLTSMPPVFDQTSCANYQKSGINLDKDFRTDLGNIGNGASNSQSNVIIEKPRMFSKPFSFKGRIRRLEYGLSYLLIYLIFLPINVTPEENVTEGMAIFYLLIYIPILWFFWAQGAKRCHDRGNSGWYQLIPFYGLWLLFGDGEEGENKYGVNPKGHN